MARKNPFRGFNDFISETNRTTENWMTGAHLSGGEESRQGQSPALAPITDIFTRGEDMVVRCDLPGVKHDDLDITLSNGILSISAERKVPEDERDASFYVSERNYGFLRRSMSLPEGIGEKDINALFEGGVLEVVITGGSKLPGPRRVQIAGSNE
ncbi:MAG: Hsp20/alpha crystallin family protein [Rubrobacter sp.]|nr:Hsp20/alpha crystallin family protein [Rubrobacter sp.]